MVGEPPSSVEWQDPGSRENSSGHRVRCIQTGLGGNLPRSPNRGSLVQERSPDAHQLSGGTGSIFSGEMLCQSKEEFDSYAQNRQHECSHLCEQSWRNSVTEPDVHHQGALDVVHAKGHNTSSRTPAGGAEHCATVGNHDVNRMCPGKNLQISCHSWK